MELNSPISKLPYDIVVIIFDMIGIGNTTCLGLTCRQLYHCLKEFHPAPISLKNPVLQMPKWPKSWDDLASCVQCRRGDWEACKRSLGLTLQQWMGPKYRLFNTEDLSHFLKISVYEKASEDCVSSQEIGLFWRYSDWQDIYSLIENELPAQDGTLTKPVLPSPINLGDKWYDKAFDYIRY